MFFAYLFTFTVVTGAKHFPDLNPVSLVRLDTPFFNTFQLTCSVSVPKETNVKVSFSWAEDSVNLPGNTSKSFTTVENPTTVDSTQLSVLNVALRHTGADMPQVYIYQCGAALYEGASSKALKNATATVKGVYLSVKIHVFGGGSIVI